MRVLTVVFALVILAACGERAARPAPDTVRTISQGEIVGIERGEARAWLAVPYAAAPEGALRWRAPRPAPLFEGRFEATAHGERCAQITTGFDRVSGERAGRIAGSEDCLTLDVYAPEGAGPDDAGRPVMVWIHGGGNVWGRSARYDGASLAAGQDVVVVAIQYRLGPLGFFAHEALRADAETRADAAANFALLDMIAALEWVREDIAAFGGDPGRVTVFGESAGGHNVAGLLASPLAEGLFHRAIIQSGSFESVSLREAERGGRGIANPSGPAAAMITGGQLSAEALRAADLDAVFGAYEQTGGAFLNLPRMIADGVTLPAEGLRAALENPGSFNDVPVITGVNRDEMKLFNLFDDNLTRRRFGVLYEARDPDFYDAISEHQSRAWRVAAVDGPATAMVRGGHRDVWAYRFDWDEGGSLLGMDMSRLLGAAHAMEIPFVFDHFRYFGPLDRLLFTRANREGREALSAEMGARWAAFARDGEPGEGWARWTPDGALMRFDSPEGGGPEMIEGGDGFEAMAMDLAADERVSEAQRCQIVRSVMAWRSGAEALAAACPD
ncbi:carboxylesterase family protein [Glycocaulis profundi]|nr:carboxylesterase family protein [Glycocaulis profundi]